MNQIKTDVGREHLTLDRGEVISGRLVLEEWKAATSGRRWGSLCKEGQGPSEAISAIAAGEGNRSFRLKGLTALYCRRSG